MKESYFCSADSEKEIAIAICKKEEGFRSIVYRCSEGYPTIGFGEKIGQKGESLEKYKNLVVSVKDASDFVDKRVDLIINSLKNFIWYSDLNTARRAIIVSMCYQMGVVGVFKFKNMINALSKYDFVEAKKQAIDSKWARQTPARANRHADVLESGFIETSYPRI